MGFDIDRRVVLKRGEGYRRNFSDFRQHVGKVDVSIDIAVDKIGIEGHVLSAFGLWPRGYVEMFDFDAFSHIVGETGIADKDVAFYIVDVVSREYGVNVCIQSVFRIFVLKMQVV